jgi:recombination protein RecA
MVRSHAIDIVVVDSVAALVPKAEIEGDMGALHVGLQARLMSQALRKLTSFTARSNCIVIFINQLRDKIGVTYGSSETTTGGRALKFYASVRVDIRKSTKIEVAEVQVGNRTNIKITKNKVAPPFKKCEVDMMFGEGISKYGDMLDLGSQLNIVKKSGSWFGYGDIRLGQGRENAKTYIKEHPALALEIENKAREHFGMKKLEELALPENNLVIDQNDDDDDDALDIELIDEDLLADDDAVLVRGEEELVYETV